MLGEYVARIYDQVRQRPLYLIDRAVNMSPQVGNDSKPSTQEKDAAYEQLLKESNDLVRMVEVHPPVEEAPTACVVEG
jgi:hypothetical protein